MQSMEAISHPNPEKPLTLTIDGIPYTRYPIHTHVIQVGESLSELVRRYVLPYYQPGDMVYISEKIVSLCQRNIIPRESLKIGPLARFLSRFASTNDSAGIGVNNVYKMQVAINLCGRLKILWAALAAGVGKLFGKSGVFYEIAGPQVAGLDGFYSQYFDEYQKFGILVPKEPEKACRAVEEETGVACVIADINDFGGDLLGVSPHAPFSRELLLALLKDNPAGNGRELTPFVLLRAQKPGEAG